MPDTTAAAPANSPHACGNCEGISPETCLVNPDRPRGGQPGPAPVDPAPTGVGAAPDSANGSADPIGTDALRQRVTEAIRQAAHDCDGNCGKTDEACTDQHPLQVGAWHHGQVAQVWGPPDAIADAVLAALRPELDELADYRNRITWETTCGEHTALLDACRTADERAEQAEAILRDLVGLTAVTHAHRIQGGHDTLGPGLTCAGCALAERARQHLAGQPATSTNGQQS